LFYSCAQYNCGLTVRNKRICYVMLPHWGRWGGSCVLRCTYYRPTFNFTNCFLLTLTLGVPPFHHLSSLSSTLEVGHHPLPLQVGPLSLPLLRSRPPLRPGVWGAHYVSCPAGPGGTRPPNIFCCILGINLHRFDCLVMNNFLCLLSTERKFP